MSVYFGANFSLGAVKCRDWFESGDGKGTVSVGYHVVFDALLPFRYIPRFAIPSWNVLVSAWVVCSRKEETCHHLWNLLVAMSEKMFYIVRRDLVGLRSVSRGMFFAWEIALRFLKMESRLPCRFFIVVGQQIFWQCLLGQRCDIDGSAAVSIVPLVWGLLLIIQSFDSQKSSAVPILIRSWVGSIGNQLVAVAWPWYTFCEMTDNSWLFNTSRKMSEIFMC